MKKTLHFLACMFVFVMAIQAQVKPDKVNIVIKAGKFTLNKNEISNGWKMPDAIKVLSIAAKQKDGFNRTHTYNNYGIVLFEQTNNKVASDKISEFQVYFSAPEETNNVMPEGYFKGSFTIEKLALKKDMSMDDVRAALPDYTESESYSPHNFRLAKDGLYIYFLFDEIEQTLIKVSIGKDIREG